MDEKSLTQILAEGENQRQAFLVDLSDQWNAAVIISSLANANGGSLWIGVKSNGKITGIYPEGIQKELIQLVEAFFLNPFHLETKVWKNKMHYVLEVLVKNASDEKVFLINDRKQTVLYERQNNKCVQASKIALKNIQFKSQNKTLPDELSREEEELLGFIKDKAQLSLSQMYKQVPLDKSEIDLIVTQLVYRKLVEMDFSTAVTLYKYCGL